MKSFGIFILCVSLSVAAVLFSLNGRYKVSAEGSQGMLGRWIKLDTITGRTWQIDTSKSLEWIEIIDYGYVYTKPEEKK